jgi:hypothetical protein
MEGKEGREGRKEGKEGKGRNSSTQIATFLRNQSLESALFSELRVWRCIDFLASHCILFHREANF